METVLSADAKLARFLDALGVSSLLNKFAPLSIILGYKTYLAKVSPAQVELFAKVATENFGKPITRKQKTFKVSTKGIGKPVIKTIRTWNVGKVGSCDVTLPDCVISISNRKGVK